MSRASVQLYRLVPPDRHGWGWNRTLAAYAGEETDMLDLLKRRPSLTDLYEARISFYYEGRDRPFDFRALSARMRDEQNRMLHVRVVASSLREAEAAALGEAIRVSARVHDLAICLDHIQDSSLAVLLAAVKENKRIRTFQFKLKAYKFIYLGNHFSKLLLDNKTLQELCITVDTLAAMDARHICEALLHNGGLHTLAINARHSIRFQFPAGYPSPSFGPHLRHLYLDTCFIDASCTNTLARMVRNSKSLRAISIRPPFLDRASAIDLIEAATEHGSLESATLTWTNKLVSMRPALRASTAFNRRRHRHQRFVGVARSIWLLLAAWKDTLRPGGPAFKRAKISFEAGAAALSAGNSH